MKSLFIAFVCMMSFTVFSQVDNGTAEKNTTPDYLMDDIPLERKLLRLATAENGIYRLPFEKEHIQSTIIPEVEAKRGEIAPHYPDVTGVSDAERTQLLEDWIKGNIFEYDDYILYLEMYLRSFR